MNFKTIGSSLATAVIMATGAVLSESPAQAITLANGRLDGILSFSLDNLNLVQSVNSNLVDLNNNSFTLPSPAGTGDFSTYTTGQFLNDLPTTLTSGNLPFLKLTGGIEGEIIYYLKALNTSAPGGGFTEIANINDGLGSFTARLTGVFQPFGQPGISTDDFVVTFKKKLGNGGTIEITPVPTPALLPGLIGMGVAALRKKRKEEDTETAKTATANA